MVTATCINKVRDNNGKIISYILQDSNGTKMPVEALQLKDAIFRGAIVINNLKLTSDGRLIDAKQEETNTENDIVAKEDMVAAKKIAVETAESLKKLLMTDAFKCRNIVFKINDVDSKRLPTILIEVDSNGAINNRLGIRVTTKSISDEIKRVSNGKNICMAIGINATVKKYIKDQEVLTDYTVYCGWIHNDSNEVICTSEMQKLAILYNSTLDLMEYAYYSGDITGSINKTDRKGNVLGCVDIASPILYYDIVKTLGLVNKTFGPMGLATKLPSKTIELAINKAIASCTTDDITNEACNNEIAKEHFEKARKSAMEACNTSEESGIVNFTTLSRDKAEKHFKLKNSKENSIFNMFKR